MKKLTVLLGLSLLTYNVSYCNYYVYKSTNRENVEKYTSSKLLAPATQGVLTISSSAVNNTICSGEKVKFMANLSNPPADVSITYEWRIYPNTSPVKMSTDPFYETSSLKHLDVIQCTAIWKINGNITLQEVSSNQIVTNVTKKPTTPTGVFNDSPANVGDGVLLRLYSDQGVLFDVEAPNGQIDANLDGLKWFSGVQPIDGGKYKITAILNGCRSDVGTATLVVNGGGDQTVKQVDFSADNTAPCLNEAVSFTDKSMSQAGSYKWTFTPNTVEFLNGTTASSRDVVVKFTSPGNYTVGLTAIYSAGSPMETKANYIKVSSTSLLFPVQENFETESFPPLGWTIENTDAPSTSWGMFGNKGPERQPAGGNTGSEKGSLGMDFGHNMSSPTIDNFLSGSIDLTSAVKPILTFKRAYGPYATASTVKTDYLKVFISKDCGKTWNEEYFKTGQNLITKLNSAADYFTWKPAAEGDWKIDTVKLDAYVNENVRVKFEIGSTELLGNFFLDDINLMEKAADATSISISSSETDNQFCENTNVTFTATPNSPVNGGKYIWKINTIEQGETSNVFSTSTLKNNDQVTCELQIGSNTPLVSNSISNTVSSAPALPVLTSNSPLCAGSDLKLESTADAGVTYAWTGPNSFTNSTDKPVIESTTAAMAGDYKLIVSKDGCNSAEGTVNVVINSDLVPTITVTADNNPICEGATVLFTAKGENGGDQVSYEWKINNNVVLNETKATLSASNLKDGDKVVCKVISSLTCANPKEANSMELEMKTATEIAPSVSITANKTNICSGESVEFDAVPVNGGSSPTYTWKINGNEVVGQTASKFQSSNLADKDVVTCELKSSLSCASPTNVTSSEVKISLATNVVPTITIDETANPICTNSSAKFATKVTNEGTAPKYVWTVNDNVIADQTGAIFDGALVAGDKLKCTLTSSLSCATNPEAISKEIIIVTGDSFTPTITVTPSAKSICSGTSVVYTAKIENGGDAAKYEWMINGAIQANETTSTFTSSTFADKAVVTCKLTSSLSCATTKIATSIGEALEVKPSLTPSIKITPSKNPACIGDAVKFTSEIASGGTAPTYSWKLNGAEVGTATMYESSTLKSFDVLVCELMVAGTCVSQAKVVSEPVAMNISEIKTPSIKIAIDGQGPYCLSKELKLNATAENQGENATYNWKVNGEPVSDAGPTYSASNFVDKDFVTCEVKSSAQCLTKNTVESDKIDLTISPLVTPSLVIAADVPNPICKGKNVTFNATPTHGGAAPEYHWKLNGTDVGTNSDKFSSTELKDNDEVKCIIISNEVCLSSTDGSSAPYIMTVGEVPPTPTIFENNGILSSSATTGNQWFLNDVSQPLLVTQDITPVLNGDYSLTVTVGGCTSEPSAKVNYAKASLEDLSFEENMVQIFPNPTAGKFTVTFNSNVKGQQTVEIQDAIGQVVMQRECTVDAINYSSDFDLSTLAKGTYFLHVSNSDKQKAFKIIVY